MKPDPFSLPLTFRLLPYQVADGPTNMATDEVLLQAAASGVATLRFYGWSVPTVSLGYFQREACRQDDPRLAALPFVRRPTGGDTLVHHHELTYAVGLPREWLAGEPWLLRMHRMIAAALSEFGIAAQVVDPGPTAAFVGPLCFHHFTPGDLLVNGAKVVGSAQRKHRGALLQHGGILLAQSPHTPTLPGILELTGVRIDAGQLANAIADTFARETASAQLPADLRPAELEQARELVRLKYTAPAWNRKR